MLHPPGIHSHQLTWLTSPPEHHPQPAPLHARSGSLLRLQRSNECVWHCACTCKT